MQGPGGMQGGPQGGGQGGGGDKGGGGSETFKVTFTKQ